MTTEPHDHDETDEDTSGYPPPIPVDLTGQRIPLGARIEDIPLTGRWL